MSFTYDTAQLAASTATGRRTQVRLLITDTVNTTDQPAIFADEELDAFLSLKSADVYEAAAFAYETWARSMGRVALIMSRDGFTSRRQAMDHLFDAAEKLRQAKLRGTLQTGSIVGTDSGDYLDEYRPIFREFTDAPVAE